jgi:protocatechuate 3,4-dioxygenase beta subunit
VTGSVTDSNNAALAGVSVSLTPASSTSGLTSYSTITTSTGAYSFTSVAPGSYILHASDTGYTGYESSAITISVGVNAEPTIKLTKIIYGSVAGLITDANGKPIANASVIIVNAATGTSVSGVAELHTLSNGTYSFPSIPVGSYEIRAYAAGYFEGTTVAFAVVQGANTAPTLKLTQGATVTGTVTDSNNAPLSGASVSLTPASSTSGLTSYSTTTTSTGGYTFGLVTPGSYILHASDTGYTGYESSAITISVGVNAEPTIKLTKIIYGSVAGLITDANGKPIANASVIIVNAATGTSVSGVAELHTLSNGTYSFPSIPVGSYEIRAYAAGYFEGTTVAFAVVQGANTAPTLKLTQGATVTGSVTSTSSTPLAGAAVSLTPASGTHRLNKLFDHHHFRRRLHIRHRRSGKLCVACFGCRLFRHGVGDHHHFGWRQFTSDGCADQRGLRQCQRESDRRQRQPHRRRDCHHRFFKFDQPQRAFDNNRREWQLLVPECSGGQR